MQPKTTHTHVRARPHKRIRNRVDKLPRDAKVADLDLPLRAREDVGRLDVAVDDAVHVVEVDEAAEDCFGDLADDVDWDRAGLAVDEVEGSGVSASREQSERASGESAVERNQLRS